MTTTPSTRVIGSSYSHQQRAERPGERRPSATNTSVKPATNSADAEQHAAARRGACGHEPRSARSAPTVGRPGHPAEVPEVRRGPAAARTATRTTRARRSARPGTASSMRPGERRSRPKASPTRRRRVTARHGGARPATSSTIARSVDASARPRMRAGDPALPVQHDGRRHGLQRHGALQRGDAAPSVSSRRRVRDLERALEGLRGAGVVGPVDAEQLHAVGGVVGRQGDEVGGLGAARRARGVPGVEHDDVAAPVGDVDCARPRSRCRPARRGSRAVGRRPGASWCRRRTRSPGPSTSSGVAGRASGAQPPSASQPRHGERRHDGGTTAASAHVTPRRPVARRAAGPRRARV